MKNIKQTHTLIMPSMFKTGKMYETISPGREDILTSNRNHFSLIYCSFSLISNGRVLAPEY